MSILIAVMKEFMALGLEGDELVAAMERVAGQMPSEGRSARSERNARYYAARKAKASGIKTSEPSETSELDGERLNASEFSASEKGFPTPLPKTSPTKENPPKGGQKKGSPSPDADFGRFWDAYPKRDGGDPRKPAAENFARAVRNGTDPETIIRGALAFARSWEGREKRERQFIPMARVWLNQERWTDQTAAPSNAPSAVIADTEEVPEKIWRHHVKRCVEQGFWPTTRRVYGGKPGEPDCKAPPHILAEFGVSIRTEKAA